MPDLEPDPNVKGPVESYKTGPARVALAFQSPRSTGALKVPAETSSPACTLAGAFSFKAPFPTTSDVHSMVLRPSLSTE